MPAVRVREAPWTAKLIETGVAAWNAKDEEAFLALYADDCVITLPGGVVLQGRDGVQMFWHGYQDAFPDNRVVLRTAFGTDDEGTEEAVFEGTHTAPLLAGDGSQVLATGRSVASPFAAVYTIHAGKIVRSRLYFDQAELLTQLGVMPQPVQ